MRIAFSIYNHSIGSKKRSLMSSAFKILKKYFLLRILYPAELSFRI